jgi:hypothetical protein
VGPLQIISIEAEHGPRCKQSLLSPLPQYASFIRAEFKSLLDALELRIPDAKALRFFRICDNDGSGEIDFEEFRTVLYATDPGGRVVQSACMRAGL